MSSSTLLTVDAAINLVLGVLLVLFPAGLVAALGIPHAEMTFYPSMLGAVLCGIGIALLIERVRGASGLGLAGAVSINLTAGLVLAGWLIWGALALPTRGRVVLWSLVAVLVGISTLELGAAARGRGKRAA
jgi:hypothetical protein